jgi:hypothetical protein
MRRDHWATADVPLVPSFRDRAPALLGGFSHYELYAAIAQAMRSRGKYVLANTFAHAHSFYAHLFDVLGAGESNTLDVFHNVENLSYCRALAYHKPVSHMNYAYLKTDVPLADKQRAIHRNLVYGVWPGTGDGGRLEPIEAIRPLYRRYMPIFRALAAAGWEPVTYARAQPAGVIVERYGKPGGGPLLLAVHNATALPAHATVTLGPEMPAPAGPVGDLVSRAKVKPKGRGLAVALAPWQTAVLALRPQADVGR